MSDNENCSPPNKRIPWNKGKLIGARPPLRPKHVWSIRTRLLLQGRIRDLALFYLAIDSKLRGCDVVKIKIGELVSGGRVGGSRSARLSECRSTAEPELSKCLLLV